MKQFKISKKEKSQLVLLIVFGIPTYVLMRGIYGFIGDVFKDDSFSMMIFGLVLLLMAYYFFDGKKK